MKKETVAIIILLVMSVLYAVNIAVITNTIDKIAEQAEKANAYADEENWDEAEKCSKKMSELWESNRGYFFVVLRHDVIDNTSDCIYDMCQVISSQDGDVFGAAKRVTARLDSIKDGERISFESVF